MCVCVCVCACAFLCWCLCFCVIILYFHCSVVHMLNTRAIKCEKKSDIHRSGRWMEEECGEIKDKMTGKREK